MSVPRQLAAPRRAIKAISVLSSLPPEIGSVGRPRFAPGVAFGQAFALHALREIVGRLSESVAEALSLVGLMNLLRGDATRHHRSQQSACQAYPKSVAEFAMYRAAHWIPQRAMR